ncbi:efflux RND transporter permease subunit [uncultured Bacteroides sp.]|uniref:efflux RND transporter permease subunit n=1 Tax=uncultured Bacteroides sp. TaxID=162156 RepID=UPI002AAC1289|nr:efflux RND transporter permease subunit [uncultured Bacteroides sp.]
MKRDFFYTYKTPLLVIVVLILFGGAFSLLKIKTSLFPQVTFPKIKVIAEAGQQPVDLMAVSVTRPLENAIKKVADLKSVRSTTSRGSCEISAFVDWKADVNIAQQQVESRINEIRNQLPQNTNITVEKMDPSILAVMGYSLNSNKRSNIELKQLALYTIKPFLSQVEGVSEIRIIGGETKEYWVNLDKEKMSQLGLTPSAVKERMNNTNFLLANGYLSDYRLMYLSVTDARIMNLEQLGNTVIKNDGKRIIKLNDIAKVEIHKAKEYIKTNANGKESVLIAVIQQPNANVSDISSNMEKQLEKLKIIIPSDVQIKPYYVQADFVNDSIRSVTDCLFIGLFLAIIVVVGFLKSWRASLTILITIPVTLGLTLLVLYATGQTFNIMTLGAIAASVGLIIDDAIVVVEQIHRTHEENPDESDNVVVHKAIKYLFKAMIGSSMSTIVIFVPFMLMTGVAGAYFKVMTNTMIITLICSFLATWILLPVVYLFLGRKVRYKEQENHEVKERRWVGYFISRPYYSIAFIVVIIAMAAYAIPNLETGFLPEMDEGSIVMDYASPPGTTLEETDNMLVKIEQALVKIPEVETYSRRTGTQMGFFITEPNTGDYLIQLKKNRGRTTDEVINDIRSKIESTQPALRVDFGQVIGDMLGDLMSSVQPIEVKIFGPDQDIIQKYAKSVAKLVNKIPGTADVFNGIVIAGPSIAIVPDFQKLAQYNISPTDFQFQLQTVMEGNEAGTVFDKQQLTPIRLIYNSNNGVSAQDIENSQIFLPNGQQKLLKEFARVDIKSGSNEIQREDLQTMGVITARLDKGDLGGTMKSIQNEIRHHISLPKGYSITYGGAYAQQQQSFKELLLILILSCMLVFTVILFMFRDLKVAFTILLVSVLGICGSYILLYITGTALNVGSYTGIIMMVGIIGENAIFTYLQYHESLLAMSRKHALIYAISTRLRPKLMTAIGAVIALLPLAMGIGTGAQLHQPLAIAVIGGFIVALPLLLIVLPTFIYRIKPSHT